MTGVALLIAAMIVGVLGESLAEKGLWSRTINIAWAIIGILLIVAAGLLLLAAVGSWR